MKRIAKNEVLLIFDTGEQAKDWIQKYAPKSKRLGYDIDDFQSVPKGPEKLLVMYPVTPAPHKPLREATPAVQEEE